MLQLIVDWDL